MADTTTALQTAHRNATKKIRVPVYSGQTIYGGQNVNRNTAGYAVNGGDHANEKFIGVAHACADNSAGASGDIDVELWQDGDHEFLMSSVAQSALGRNVWPLHNNQWCFSAFAFQSIRSRFKSWSVTVTVQTPLSSTASAPSGAPPFRVTSAA